MVRTYPLVLVAVVLLMTAIMIGCPLPERTYFGTDGGGQGQGGAEDVPGTSCMTVADCGTPKPCRKIACTANTCRNVADDNAKPDDGDPCTDDWCKGGVPQTSTPSAAGTPCAGMGSKVCDDAGVCVTCVNDANCAGTAPTCIKKTHTCISCSDGLQNGMEKSTDCGGNCPTKCSGESCTTPDECQSGVCAGGICRLAPGAPCSIDEECSTARCSSNVCTACSSASDCVSNGCTVPNCKALGGSFCRIDDDCVGESCDKHKLLCGKSNFSPCGGDIDCTSRHCAGNLCAACSPMSPCNVGECDATSGYCTIPAGDFCTSTSKCSSGLLCQGFPSTCQ